MDSLLSPPIWLATAPAERSGVVDREIVNSHEVSAGSDAGLSAMSVQDMLSDESDAAEDSIVEADVQDDDLDDVDESSEESEISDSAEELTDTAAEQDAGSDAVLSDNSVTDSGDSDDIQELTP